MGDTGAEGGSTDSRSLADALQRVGAQDRAAFEQVYLRTSAKLFGICLRILGNRSDAEGTLQDVYVTVWQKAGGYDPSRASPISWLAAVARNKSIDRLRRRRATQPLDDQVMQIKDDAPDAAAMLESADEGHRIEHCLEELDKDQSGAIRSAFFGGFTYSDLALRDKVPLGTMKSRVRRGLIRLKECLQR